MKNELMMLFLLVLMSIVTINAEVGCTFVESNQSVYVNTIAGNDVNICFDIDKLGYVITDNKHNLDGLSILYDAQEKMLTLYFDIAYKPDTLKFTVFDMDREVSLPENVRVISRGGGTRIVYRNNTITEVETITEYVELECDDCDDDIKLNDGDNNNTMIDDVEGSSIWVKILWVVGIILFAFLVAIFIRFITT